MRRLRLVRIVLAALALLALTACFCDFTGRAARWLGWTAKLQLVPAALALSAVAAAILVLTLLVGRVYCSVACPLGIAQDVAFFLRRKLGRPLPPVRAGGAPAVARARTATRVLLLAVFVAGGVLGLHFAWLEPYAIYGRAATCLAAPLARSGNNALAAWAERHGSYAFHAVEALAPPLALVVLSAALLALILALAAGRGRVWCNWVCPVGTLLGGLSRLSLLGPGIDARKCVKCRLCERACKARCIDIAAGGRIDRSRCVACFDCGAVCGKGAISWTR